MTKAPADSGAGGAHHWQYTFAARGLSLVMAVGLSALILIYPKAIARSATEIDHGMLSLLMWGIAAGFVHGVGFVPEHRLLRILLGPIVAWLLMGLGLFNIYLSG